MHAGIRRGFVRSLSDLQLLHVELQYVQRQRHVHCMQRWDRGYTDCWFAPAGTLYTLRHHLHGVYQLHRRHVMYSLRPVLRIQQHWLRSLRYFRSYEQLRTVQHKRHLYELRHFRLHASRRNRTLPALQLLHARLPDLRLDNQLPKLRFGQ